jgi:RNA polymerase sigma-70 factor, ECF subfamily
MATDYTSDSGVQLMLAYQAGDETAFSRLVEDYSGMVFALLTRFLGRKPGREDMVQEVFLRVIRARDRYEPTARFSTWLYRIVFNLSVNETQRVAHKNTVSLDKPVGDGDAGTLLDLQDGEMGEPSEDLERNDVVKAVREAIAALPEKQRAAVILAKYHDTPYAEIGEILGGSEKAIKSLIHRARETLREALAPFIEETEGDVL